MLLEKEYKIVNGRKVPKRMKDYTLDELRQKLADYYKTMDRQHGRKPRVTEEDRIFTDDNKEKKRLWNNYRSIISRHEKIALEKWQQSLRLQHTINE